MCVCITAPFIFLAPQLHGIFYFIFCVFYGPRLLLRMSRWRATARRLQPKSRFRRSRRKSNPRMWNQQRNLKKPRWTKRNQLRVHPGRRRLILRPKTNLLRSPCLIRFHTRIPTVYEKFDHGVQSIPNQDVSGSLTAVRISKVPQERSPDQSSPDPCALEGVRGKVLGSEGCVAIGDQT